MKILLDSCVWGGVVDTLRALGHDVVWTGTWEKDPGDREILESARREGRILVTLDKDFGELAIVRGLSHAGIIRLVNQSASQQAAACQQILLRHGSDLQKGAIVTVEPGRLRIRLAKP